MNFLQEVLAYNDELRGQGVTVVVGHLHGDDDQMNFIYTFGEEQHEMLIALEPTDYTEWNALRDWVIENLR